MDRLTARQYEQLFAGFIRTLVNWRRFRTRRPPIALHVVDDREALGDLVLPWYVVKGKPGRLSQPGATPLQAKRVGVDLTRAVEPSRAKVLGLAHQFAQDPPGPMLLPAWRVPQGHLVLDGVHRAIALWIAGVKPSILLAVVRGPADPGWALDLEHHA